ncbi:MAG: HlyD family efflux transporter periplasmic adaptor subunit [Bacteroidales bacterium]|nr:HlyD family efflux transporter periplasmic adaptor subunit [Bacteroidales bacterium]
MPAERSSRKIELQRNEVEDMLGRIPGWITRNGSILFLFLLALLIFGSWVFKYPDTKRARIVVTSVNPPADLEARTSGKIVRLFVNDNELVTAGDVLVMIENPAIFEDVMQLKTGLAFLDSIHIEDIPDDLPELKNVQLGTIQTNYSIFLKAYRDYVEFKRLDYHQRRIQLLHSELVKQQEYTSSLSERARIAEEEYNLALRQFNRNATLYEESVVSESDLENSRSQMLGKRNNWQEIVSLIAENNINVGRIGEQIVDLELKQQEERSRNINTLEESLNNLKASTASWEQNYLLVAPVSGAVTFNRFWSENQNVKAGEKVLTIIQAESGSMVGKISLPMAGAGKVKIGHQVNIQFDNYPHLEFGMVKGYVSNISKVPDDDFYTVEVELPAGLRTYYNYEITFSQNMQGQAEILTDKMRMLQRVLNPIKSAITKQVEM